MPCVLFLYYHFLPVMETMAEEEEMIFKRVSFGKQSSW